VEASHSPVLLTACKFTLPGTGARLPSAAAAASWSAPAVGTTDPSSVANCTTAAGNCPVGAWLPVFVSVPEPPGSTCVYVPADVLVCTPVMLNCVACCCVQVSLIVVLGPVAWSVAEPLPDSW
jgi:hypothetical protein